MPSSDRVKASSAAIRRAEERPEEPSASALSASYRVVDDRRTGDPQCSPFAYFMCSRKSPEPSRFSAPRRRRVSHAPASSRQTPHAAAAKVQDRLREDNMATTLEAETRPDKSPGLRVEDVEYQRQGGHALLARIYRPAGTGPYPA